MIDSADIQNRLDLRYIYSSAKECKEWMQEMIEKEGLDIFTGCVTNPDEIQKLYNDIIDNTSCATGSTLI